MVGFILCCSSCCVIVGLGYAVKFRCHIIHVMLTGVVGNAAVEQGHAVCGCRNGCMCLVWMWGEWCISRCIGGGVGVYVAGELVQVLME